jgi:ABC-2 type transport system ATP-binding protein
VSFKTVIDVQDLSKSYTTKKMKKLHALRNLSLEVKEGEVFGFLGPNGAGKSTTIKTLMGLIRPTAGKACIYGLPVSEHAARNRVGYLPENPAFYDFLSAREYLHFVGAFFGMDHSAIKIHSERVLTLLDLNASAGRPIRGYSKGMVQRLGLAQALLHDPDLYVLDEPMSGLDPIGRALVKDIILDLKKQGKTVFFSSHITSDVETVCDRVGIIVEGRLQTLKDVRSVLEEGIVGYQIRVRGIAARLIEELDCECCANELYVPKDRLAEVLAALQFSGVLIDLIEPRRKNLEDFFLEIVGRSCQ